MVGTEFFIFVGDDMERIENVGNARYHALDIAKNIVDRCANAGSPISDLQLQKILYYVQLAFIKNLGYRAFGEDIEAWSYGPVVPEVYRYFNGFGANEINMFYYEQRHMFINPQEDFVVDNIVKKCLTFSPWDLVELSHNPTGPWYKVFHEKGNHEVIPDRDIVLYALE